MEIDTPADWAPLRDTASFGAALSDARRRAGLDQRELADRVGVHRPAISHLENGHAVAQLELAFRVLRELGYELRLERTSGGR